MSRGYWRFIVAAVSGLVFLALSTAGYQILNEAEEQPYPAYEYQPARDHLPWAAPKYAPVTPIPYEPHCDDPKERDDADLCAQWAAVQAVEESNRLSRIGIRVNALEFGALIVSLIFTGWAAMAAAKAARIAEEATKDADKALAIAERNADAAARHATLAEVTAQRQLRAYIVLDTAKVTVENGTVHTFLKFRNTGVTPATHVRIAINTVAQFQYIPGWPIPYPETGIVTSPTIGQNHSSVIQGEMPLDDAHQWGWNQGTACIWLAGQAEYRDIFGQDRKTTIKLMYGKMFGLENGPLAAPDGNDIT